MLADARMDTLALVEEAEMKEIPEDLVTVLEAGNQGIVAVARSILESANIPCFMNGEALQELSGIALDFSFVQIQVPSKHAKEARKLLEHLHK